MRALSRFVGRDAELLRLAELIGEHRLVTVTGPGGVGKTRLVTEARRTLAASFDIEPLIAELVDLPAGSAIDACSAKLGMGSPEALGLSIGDDRALVVLDNCEHVLGTAAEFTARLVAACDSVTVLTTSRQPLGLNGEHVVVLEPLRAPSAADPDPLAAPAVDLFFDRAAAVGSPWQRTDETIATVTELCRRIDGLPLAIELAASRARLLAPAELLDLVTHRIDALTAGPRDRPDRHRSVRAAIEMSVGLLDDESRVLFLRLGAFPGPFDLALAQTAIGDDSPDRLHTIDLLGGLVDRSLVVVEPASTTTRYRLLELVHECAADGLRDAGWWDETRERLTAAMVVEADEMIAEGLERWSGALVARITARAADLIAAIEWCVDHDDDAARALRMFLPLFAVVHQSRSGAVRTVGARLLERWPAADAPLRAEALAVLATAHAIASDFGPARQLASAALEDPGATAIGVVLAHRCLVLTAIGQGDTEDALAHVLRGREVAGRAPLPPFERELMGFEASLLDRAGRAEEAAALADETAEASVAAGDPVTEMWARLVSATIAMRRGRWDRARAEIVRAQTTSRAIDDGWWGGTIFRSQALLAAHEASERSASDGWDASRPVWRAAVESAAHRGDLPEIALTLRAAAAVADRGGHPETARVLLAAAPSTTELTVLPDLFDGDPGTTCAEPPAAGSARLPLVAALRTAYSALDAETPSTPAGAAPPVAVPPVAPTTPASGGDADPRPGGTLERDGDGWTVGYGDTTTRVRALKGIDDLAVLLARPGEEVHCLELMGAGVVAGDAGPELDGRARREYQQRIQDLQSEIDEARAFHDGVRAERAEAELDALVGQLSQAFGLSGRARRAGSSAERARTAVTYRIRAAIRRLREHDPQLGRHLQNAVHTGTWCAYRPEDDVLWKVDTG